VCCLPSQQKCQIAKLTFGFVSTVSKVKVKVQTRHFPVKTNYTYGTAFNLNQTGRNSSLQLTNLRGCAHLGTATVTCKYEAKCTCFTASAWCTCHNPNSVSTHPTFHPRFYCLMQAIKCPLSAQARQLEVSKL